MNLPIPTPDQIAEFKQIYLEEFGRELTQSEAWEAATTMLQLFYLGTYGFKATAPEVQKVEVPKISGEVSPKRNPGADV